MSRMRDLLAELCPGGVAWEPLGAIGELVRGNGMPKTDFVQSGVGCIHYGQIYTRYGTWTTETISFIAPEKAARLAQVDPGDLIITNTSENLDDVCKAVAWLGTEQIVTGGHATVLKHGQDPKYLSYYLQTPAFFAEKKKRATGTKVIDVSARSLATIRIPVPPIEVQREIVRILDTFSALEAGLEAELEAELEARRRQYEYYRDSLLSFGEAGVQWLPLGDVAEYVNGKAHERLVTVEGDVPLATARFISRNGEANRFVPRKNVLTPVVAGDIALVLSDLPNGRALARTYYVDNDDSVAINQRVARLRVLNRNRVSPRFLFYVLDRNPGLLAHDNGVDQTHLSKAQVVSLLIPVPPSEEQERIVRILDKFDALVNDLSMGLPAELRARRRQYEYYRDKLLTFEESAA